MAGAGSKWLIGCGLGCGAVVLLCILVGAMGVFWVRGTVSGFNEAIEAREALEQRFGRGNEFVPWADGAVPADRMETFLRVHAAPREPRERIESFFHMLPNDPEEVERLDSGSFFEKLRFGLGVARSGVGLGKDLGEFFRQRNAALDQAGMGLGEYTYIYVTAYYGWLGRSPADDEENEHVTVSVDGDTPLEDEKLERALEEALPDDPAVREQILSQLPRSGRWQTPRARRDFLAQLGNLRASLPDPGDDATRAWAARLSAEIEALEADPSRVPWADGLPDAIRVSLEPYRERLEESYSAATNPFELARNEKHGMSIQAD